MNDYIPASYVNLITYPCSAIKAKEDIKIDIIMHIKA